MTMIAEQTPTFSRYGSTALFLSGFAGLMIIAAHLATGFDTGEELWVGAAYVAVLISHARLGWLVNTRTDDASASIAPSSMASEKGAPESRPNAVFPGDDDHAPAYHSESASPNTDTRPASRSPAPLNVDLQPQSEAEMSDAEFQILARVKSAIDDERVDLYLQPIVSLPQRRPRYYEAFSRLRDAQGKILTPVNYLNAAEKANRINVIDNMILMRCIQALRRCREQDPHIVVFCNLSPATLFDRDFFREFADYLQMNADLASNLVFEFTYPAVHMLHPRTERHLAQLAERGFAFSVDHIHTLDVDWAGLRAKNFRYAKASARLLLASLQRDDTGAHLARHRKSISDAGIDLIAEKIERETDMPDITALGLDFGQGNLFGTPRPAHFYIGRDSKHGGSIPMRAEALAAVS